MNEPNQQPINQSTGNQQQTYQQPVYQQPVYQPPTGVKLKKCKYCQSDIPKKAKVCPVCKRNQPKSKLWILIVVIIVIIIACFGQLDDGETSTNSPSTNNTSKNTTVESQEAPIEYTSVDLDTMMNDLNSNALSASEKYKGQYLEITGRLDVIDASGKYIGLYQSDGYSIVGCRCNIKNDEQKSTVAQMQTGSTITLKVKITDVGEIMGYSADIIEIE